MREFSAEELEKTACDFNSDTTIVSLGSMLSTQNDPIGDIVDSIILEAPDNSSQIKQKEKRWSSPLQNSGKRRRLENSVNHNMVCAMGSSSSNAMPIYVPTPISINSNDFMELNLASNSQGMNQWDANFLDQSTTENSTLQVSEDTTSANNNRYIVNSSYEQYVPQNSSSNSQSIQNPRSDNIQVDKEEIISSIFSRLLNVTDLSDLIKMGEPV